MFLLNLLQSRRSRGDIGLAGGVDKQSRDFRRLTDEYENILSDTPNSPSGMDGEMATDQNATRLRQSRRFGPRQILRRKSSNSTVSGSTNSSPSWKSLSRHSYHSRLHSQRDSDSFMSSVMTSRGDVSFGDSGMWGTNSSGERLDPDGFLATNDGNAEPAGNQDQPKLSSFIFPAMASSLPMTGTSNMGSFLSASDYSSCDDQTTTQHESLLGKEANCDKDDLEYLTTSHCQNNYGSRRKVWNDQHSSELLLQASSPRSETKSPRPLTPDQSFEMLKSPGRERPLSRLFSPSRKEDIDERNMQLTPNRQLKSPSSRSNNGDKIQSTPGRRKNKLLRLFSPKSRKDSNDDNKAQGSPGHELKSPSSRSVERKTLTSPLWQHKSLRLRPPSPLVLPAVNQDQSKVEVKPRLERKSPSPRPMERHATKERALPAQAHKLPELTPPSLIGTKSERKLRKHKVPRPQGLNRQRTVPAEIHVSLDQVDQFPDADDWIDPTRPLILGEIADPSPLGFLANRMRECLENLARGSSAEQLLELIAEHPIVCQIMFAPVPEQGSFLCFPFHHFCAMGWMEGCVASYKAFPEAIGMECSRGLPLHYACITAKPSLEVVRFLLQMFPGGSQVANRASQQTPLHRACQLPGCDVEIVQSLIECFPAAPGLADILGYTPIHYACRYGLGCDILRALCSETSVIETVAKKSEDLSTPLHCAVLGMKKTAKMSSQKEELDPELVARLTFLISAYPDGRKCTDNQDQTPFDMAKHYKFHPEVLGMLRPDP